ncbi:unnamed protein product [Vicia faba]|uniref:Uncharacterized protein n=1 Tax=Vicia faba TaxID=3906 RepID=A0AAV1A6T9_VICFA|nr:unnamed protein product [Vicia faba]
MEDGVNEPTAEEQGSKEHIIENHAYEECVVEKSSTEGSLLLSSSYNASLWSFLHQNPSLVLKSISQTKVKASSGPNLVLQLGIETSIGMSASVPTDAENVPSDIMKTLEESKNENDEVKAQMICQEETNVMVQNLLTTMVSRLPPSY